ncbi:MAG: adenine deaminase [Planctomycetota bacterium]|jgi:adenine deaminase
MIGVKGNIVNVESGEIDEGTLFAQKGLFVDPMSRAPETVFDYTGKYIVPGFIDAHVHIESSMLTPSNFARAVLRRGTVAVVTDPHEIANVKGVLGINYMMEDAEASPLEVFFTAPSCVPATHMETAGAELGVPHLEDLLKHERIVALGEMMNFPGVVAGLDPVMDKILLAKKARKPIDGHAPGLSGEGLRKYVAAGISTDHECTTADEAREKLALGMKIMIREGSSMRNLDALAEIATPENIDKLFLVSDDIHPETILTEGHLDRILRKIVAKGVRPVDALRMVTINPAWHYDLRRLGTLRIGYRASFAVVDDLKDFHVAAVFVDGEKVAEDGKITADFHGIDVPKQISSSVNTGRVRDVDLKVSGKKDTVVNIIRVPDQWMIAPLPSDGRYLIPDRDRDILPIAVIERHMGTGKIGRAFVHGFGLQSGALASTVAHDSHNVVCVGADYPDMVFAVASLRKAGGGVVAVRDKKVLGLLELPVAGLMSTEPAEAVNEKLRDLHKSVRELGCFMESPFMALAFLALPVIPKLKLTDRGLVDVDQFKIIDVRLKQETTDYAD